MDTPSAPSFNPTQWMAAPTRSARRLLRMGVGWSILAGGVAALLVQAVAQIQSQDPAMAGALLGGMMAAAATALGTLPVLVSQRFSQRTFDTMLGFGAGVMLAASAFSLVMPALNAAKSQGAGAWGAGGMVGGGILLGALLLAVIDRMVPQDRFMHDMASSHGRALKRAWLFVLAIALHNFPEGLAIGVAFAGPDAGGAKALATGISIQDVPEGLVVALTLRAVGYGRLLSAGLGAASGLIEPVGAVLGAAVVVWSAPLLPWGLALAAGGMLYVISHEIVPESHRHGHGTWATAGLMLGFVLMMVLDTALG